jgi:SagB-type dehydrogenase family enzyme
VTVARASAGVRYALAQSYFKFDFRQPDAEDVVPMSRLRRAGASRWPLDVRFPATSVPVSQALAGVAASEAQPFVALSSLLHLGVGVHRFQAGSGVMPGRRQHRGYPSPRGIYSTELLVWLPPSDDRPEGLFHYDALRHDLALVAEAPRRWLEAVLSTTVPSAECAVFVTSDISQVIRSYTDFAYRLVCLEAGHAAQNLIVAANTVGWSHRLFHLFDDAAVDAALGIPEGRRPCFVALTFGPDEHAQPFHPVSGDAPAPSAAGWWEGATDALVLEQARRVRDVDRACRHVVRPPRPAAGSIDRVPPRPFDQSLDADLRAAWADRSAGFGLFGVSPLPAPGPKGLTEHVLGAAGVGVCNDLDGDARDGLRRVRLLGCPQREPDLAAGCYEREPDGGLRQIVAGPAPDHWLWHHEIIDHAAVGAYWPVLATYGPQYDALGDRAYRVLNVEAGLLGQQVCLLAAAAGLFARPFLAYAEAGWEEWLGLAGGDESMIYLVLTAQPRVRALGWDISL